MIQVATTIDKYNCSELKMYARPAFFESFRPKKASVFRVSDKRHKKAVLSDGFGFVVTGTATAFLVN